MPQFENIIILGNVNVDHLHKNKLEGCFMLYDFSELIREPTRITETSQKILDIIYINHKNFVTSFGVENADLVSDYNLVFCQLFFITNHIQPKVMTYRNFKNFSFDRYLFDLVNICWDDLFYILIILMKKWNFCH
ncbi:hypothetical protein BDFB_011859 [Asbolus verrucosus]|uniref:Exo endo phos 2 domain containing protein n=1 Tax=Asbolus verrucosus TaxID=1661398 RepID=A0A482VGU4_ASBVE|nr:hypothetical protein BDFB_011859 [Asbolus verrucosus]